MPNYRCYFLDSGDLVAATELIVCENDAQAQERAGTLLAASDHAGIEVWDGPWKLYRADKPRVT
jgi:hypothetical protein